MRSSAAPAHQPSSEVRLDANSPVVADAELRAGAHKESLFADDVWDLQPLAGKTTLQASTLNFTSSPEQFRDTLKRIVWCTANLITPIDMLERPTAIRTRISAGSVRHIFAVGFRTFARWLDDQGVPRFADVDEHLLDSYARHIATSNLSRAMKGQRLFGVTRIWLLAPYLPESDRIPQPPWERDGLDDLLGPANWSAENKTIPIHPQTMSPLLVWSLRIVEDLSADILAASKERDRLDGQIGTVRGTEASRRIREYLDSARASGRPLPGYVVRGQLSCARRYICASLGVSTGSFSQHDIDDLNVELSTPLTLPVTGHIDGVPWVEGLHYHAVPALREMLFAACIVTIAYLSGMRGEEVRALERGCCHPDDHDGGRPVSFRIIARSFKDALDSDGNAVRGGVVREQPWHVIAPVAKAIDVLEQLHDDDLLLPAEKFSGRKASTGQVVRDSLVNRLLSRYVDQVNDLADALDRPHERVPADPDGNITLGRFRRTLAWFIYRRPAGRIALGVQYGHLQGFTSDGYGSRVSNGLRDVFPMEEAYAIADTLNDAADRLEAGEHVSGPAADRFIAGVSEYAATYQGQYLTPRQAAKLRRNPLLRIYDNSEQMVACVYDATKALCHPDNQRTQDQAATPDLTRCVPGCTNGARTDTHVQQIEDQMAWHQQQVDAEETPEPLRQRHRQRIEALQGIAADHHATRRSSTNDGGSDTNQDHHPSGTTRTSADTSTGESGN